MCERVYEGVIRSIIKRHFPPIVVQLNFDLLGICRQGQWDRGRGHGKKFPISETQCPKSILRTGRDLEIPGYSQSGHSQKPVLVGFCLHDPMVTSCSQRGHAHHLGAHVEALRVVRATESLAGVVEGSEVVGQDEARVGSVWVQRHRGVVDVVQHFLPNSVFEVTQMLGDVNQGA